MECGLGGRLDATNVVTGPKIAVITPIEMEHVEILGPTLAHIAWEKAGIFHSDTIAWTARQPPKVIYELRKAAKNNSIPLFELKIPSEEDTASGYLPLGIDLAECFP